MLDEQYATLQDLNEKVNCSGFFLSFFLFFFFYLMIIYIISGNVGTGFL